MRLFVAINFDERTKKKLISLREAAREYCPTANFSRDENLHLTLAFLGETATERLDAVRRAMDLRANPFSLEINGAENLGRGLLTVGVRHSAPLMRLQTSLVGNLTVESFMLEARKYRPHITLAREFYAQGYMPEFTPFSTDVNSISLMKSERIRGRLTYTEIYKHVL